MGVFARDFSLFAICRIRVQIRQICANMSFLSRECFETLFRKVERDLCHSGNMHFSAAVTCGANCDESGPKMEEMRIMVSSGPASLAIVYFFSIDR